MNDFQDFLSDEILSLDNAENLGDALQRRLETIATLNTQFLKAKTESTVISALMDAAMKHARAVGASYIPMDDDGRPLTLISQGVIAQDVDIQDWESVLAAPPTKTQCRVCLKQHLITETCPLFSNPISGAHHIFCIRLNRAKGKIGILNLYLPTSQRIDPDTETYLQTLADHTSLALENLRLGAKYQKLRNSQKNGHTNPETVAEIEQAAILAERNRLGREIHDGLAQILGYVKMQLSQMEDYLQAGEESKLIHAIRTSHQAMTEAYVEAREAIDDLRATTLTDDFSSWLLETAENFQQSFGIQVIVADFPAELDFPRQVKNQLTRIIQEALSNIRKHARAKSVRISYWQDESDFAIVIRDDGIGFYTEEIENASQHGLRSMPERAAIIDSTLNIDSRPGEGTTVEIRVPHGRLT